MAGTYLNIPSDRIPYDINNTSVLYFQNSAWTALTNSQKEAINKESNSQSFVTSGNPVTFISFVFPVVYDISAIFASAIDGFDFSGAVLISTDTTNGTDGTWTQVMASLYSPANTIYWNTSPNYRTGIINITGASGIKGIRFGTTSSTRINIKALHLYGVESSSSERLEFWKSDNSAELLPYEWDFGDTTEGSSSIKEFKVKNYLEDDISKLVLSVQVPTDQSPTILSNYSLSTDQVLWSQKLEIPSVSGNIIAKNGGTSETIYLKQENPADYSSYLFTGRVVGIVNKYNRDYWTVNGNSSFVTYKQKFTDQIQIIPASSGQAGVAWYSKTLVLPISITFSYTVSSSSGTTGGDGFAIAFTDKNNSLLTLGSSGGNFGVIGANKRVVGIAFDCYQNTGDRSAPYIATFDSHAGSYSTSSPPVVQSNTSTLTTTDINGTHNVQLDITNSGTTLYLDGVSKWTSTDFHKYLPSEFVLGFGAGSGGVYARWLTSGTSLTSGTTPDPTPSQVTSGAILNFDLADPSCYSGSGTTITDLSGNGNNGTINGGISYSNEYGGILIFDGNLSHITLPTGFANFTSGFTISFITKFGNENSYERIIDISNGAYSNNLLVYRAGTGNYIGAGFYLGSSYTASTSIQDVKSYTVNNELSHYAFVANGTNYIVYKNGIQVAINNNTALPNNITRSSCYIGKSAFGDPYFEGSLASIKIYNRALSAAEIYQDFSAVRARYKI